MRDRSPTYDLACNDFLERYADLLDAHGAKFGMYEASILSAKEESIFLAVLNGRDRRREYQTVRATNHAFSKAAMKGNSQRMMIVVQNTLDNFQIGFGEACRDYWAARNIDADAPFRRRVREWMSAYQTIYESLLRTLYAPVCTAYRLAEPNRYGDEFKLDNDSRARLTAIKAIEKNSAYGIDFYRLGLNHALRNAIAHRSYEIFEREEYVEYWDGTSSRSRIEEIDVQQLCADAFLNASAILDAIVLWFVNHRAVGEKRGWIRENKPRAVSQEEFEQATKAMFAVHSFTVASTVREKHVDRFLLSTRHKGIDQTSTIFRGGDRWTESFDVHLKYLEVPIVPEILDMLRQIVGGYVTAEHLVVEVSGPDGEAIGVLSVKAGVIRRLRGPKDNPLKDVRKAFDEDTLGDATMWQEHRSAPERATPRIPIDR